MQSEEYVVARRTLLNALEALQEYRDSLVLVGAQAVYFHTDNANLAVAEHTTDGDVLINPNNLQPNPEIAAAMRSRGFYPAQPEGSIGRWSSSQEIGGVPASVYIDLILPAASGSQGASAASISQHETGAVMRVRGLEAALIDNEFQVIKALEADDKRVFNLRIAGPAALLISKCIKLGDRFNEVFSDPSNASHANRINPKDALDILRILRACDALDLGKTISMLRKNAVAGQIAKEGMHVLSAHFGSAEAMGSMLAARGAYPESADEIAASCAALTNELRKLVENN